MSNEHAFESLDQFKSWWMGTRAFRPPLDGVRFPSSTTAGIILYRFGEYQVQLFIFGPDMVIPAHRHPHVDSYEHYVSGQVYFHKGGKELLPRSAFYDKDGVAAPLLNSGHRPEVRVGPQDWHGAQIGPLGGSFLSIQKWNGPPGLVELDWVGEPLDDKHRADIG